MNEHLQKICKPEVSGHLEIRRGIYHMALTWTDSFGASGRKSCTTGLQVKGNKTKADKMLEEKKRDKLQELEYPDYTQGQLFADYMERWVESKRKKVKPTTFGGYQSNVKRAIAPYFREQGTLLHDMTAADVNSFYESLEDFLSGCTIQKYHNNIMQAIKELKKDMVPGFDATEVKRPKAEKFAASYYRESEMVELFEAAKGHRLELAVIFGAFYGLRRSEVIGLRCDGVKIELKFSINKIARHVRRFY